MVQQVESQQLAQAPVRHRPHPGSRPRIDALDMTKGVLVAAMVVYHSFNYSTDYTLAFKYLPFRFVPPAFILITGFLISRLYFTPEASRDLSVYCRLLFRGFRLLFLFTALNVLTQLVGRQKAINTPQGLSYLLDYWYEIYAIGGGQYATFSILLPIAYLLLLAPVLILLYRAHSLFALLTAVALAIFFILQGEGESFFNLALMSAGLIGVILGRVPDKALFLLRRYWYLPLIVYAGYVAFTHLVWQSPFDDLLNALLALAAIFSLCAAIGARRWFGRELLVVGRYSLVAYIFQIALLQVLVRLFGRLQPFTGAFFFQMTCVAMAMILMAECLEWARRRATWIDASYRFIFA
jgi:Acyltransferase family